MIIVQSPSGIWKEHHRHLAIFFSMDHYQHFLKLPWKSVQDFLSYFAHKETSASCHIASLVEKVITVCGSNSSVNGDLDRKGKKPPLVLTIVGGQRTFPSLWRNCDLLLESIQTYESVLCLFVFNLESTIQGCAAVYQLGLSVECDEGPNLEVTNSLQDMVHLPNGSLQFFTLCWLIS